MADARPSRHNSSSGSRASSGVQPAVSAGTSDDGYSVNHASGASSVNDEHANHSGSAARSRASSNVTRDISDYDDHSSESDSESGDEDEGDDDDDDDDYAGFDGDEDAGSSAPIRGLHPASKQTTKDFRRLFNSKEVPETDVVYKAYTCAWSKEILYQGRMFVTSHHVCFHSKIFGMTQKVVLPFNTITKIEPKMLMNIIPNSIAIRTIEDKRYMFTSFTNRGRTLGFLRKLRNSGGVSTASSPPGTPGTEPVSPGQLSRRDSGKGSVSAVSAGVPLSSVRSSQGGKTRPANQQTAFQAAAASVNKSFEEVINIFPSSNSNSSPPMASKSGATKAPVPAAAPVAAAPGAAPAGGAAGAKWPVENLGAEEHARTSLPEPAEHEKVLATSTIRAPPGVVANILFGKDASWYKHFLVEIEHNRDLDKFVAFPSLQVGNERSFEYIKPLNGPVGPKQTKCLSTEKIEKWDLENYIEVITTTATPDVPSGSSFTTLTRTVLAWGEGNGTQIRLGTWLEWTGKTWLKGPIEKGAIDGQTSFCKSLVAELAKKVEVGGRGAGGKAADPSKLKPADVESGSSESKEKSARKSSTAKQASQAIREWQQLCIGLSIALVVLFLLVIVFWRRSRHHARGPSTEDQRSLLRLQQELELWQWIEDRKDTRISHRRTLSDINIEKAMAAAEKKLASLKAALT